MNAYPPEREFLIGYAVTRFNEQYARYVDPGDFDIKSIPVRYEADRSYEVFTTRLDDNLRLHIHVKFEGTDKLSPYRIELDTSVIEDGVGDEMFVAVGTIDPYYMNNNIYKFRQLSADESLLNILVLADETPLYMVDGGYFLLA